MCHAREKPFYFQAKQDLEFKTDALSKADKIEVPLKVESCSIKYIALNATKGYVADMYAKQKTYIFHLKLLFKKS